MRSTARPTGRIGRALPCAAIAVAFVGLGCAQVEAPSGGPVDSEAPRVAGLSPDSGSVGVVPDTISILFSKRMDRRSVRDWLFLSPPLPIRERHWEGDRLDLVLGASPDTGRTYSLLIGAEAKDRRGNALGPWEASFSTGTRLDDGVVEGRVRGGRLRVAGVYLFVWPWDDPSNLEDSELPGPLRMGQAEKSGGFRIGSLPRGVALRICALYDTHGDRAYDPGEDLWGCLEEPVRLDDTTRVRRDLEVYLVLPDEPGTVKGSAVDTTCLGRGAVLLAGLAREADSLGARIAPRAGIPSDTLLGFGGTEVPDVDTVAVRARLAQIDSLRSIARDDSIRCSKPVIVRLFENDTSLVEETRGDGAYTFRDVSPGIYRIRAFRDADGDGRPGAGEVAGECPFAIELKPGREVSGLEFPMRPTP